MLLLLGEHIVHPQAAADGKIGLIVAPADGRAHCDLHLLPVSPNSLLHLRTGSTAQKKHRHSVRWPYKVLLLAEVDGRLLVPLEVPVVENDHTSGSAGPAELVFGGDMTASSPHQAPLALHRAGREQVPRSDDLSFRHLLGAQGLVIAPRAPLHHLADPQLHVPRHRMQRSLIPDRSPVVADEPDVVVVEEQLGGGGGSEGDPAGAAGGGAGDARALGVADGCGEAERQPGLKH
mmetsp:Transcript_16804/g.42782  ORF Transcript_16804/g.42782 Transcript_16804/m.42782 type:complete len:234 (-) Transcript_16804:77-778(-)